MLQFQGAEPATLRILKELMVNVELIQFHLCRGTALALHFGHRLSVDIDLFTESQFSKEVLNETLQKSFIDFKEVFTPVKSFYFSYINQVKVDFIYS
jgi:hypothetical protein